MFLSMMKVKICNSAVLFKTCSLGAVLCTLITLACDNKNQQGQTESLVFTLEPSALLTKQPSALLTKQLSAIPAKNVGQENLPPRNAFQQIELSFFLFNITLLDVDGGRFPMEVLSRAGEPRALAKVSLNNTQGQATIPLRYTSSLGTAKPAFNGIEFVVGVPAALNHGNPLSATAPLNDTAMLWSWQQGYKFFRMDTAGSNAAGVSTKSAFHLGSTGCVSPSALRPPAEPCAHHNRVTIRLTGFNPVREGVAVEASALTSLFPQQPAFNCTMHYAMDKNCSALLEAFGLNVATGQCVNQCASQKVFRRGRHLSERQ